MGWTSTASSRSPAVNRSARPTTTRRPAIPHLEANIFVLDLKRTWEAIIIGPGSAGSPEAKRLVALAKKLGVPALINPPSGYADVGFIRVSSGIRVRRRSPSGPALGDQSRRTERARAAQARSSTACTSL